MRRSRTFGRLPNARAVLLIWAFGAALGACNGFDPIKVEDLCTGADPLPDCPQCREVPYAAECPQCRVSGAFEDGTCSTTDPLTEDGASGAAEGGEGGTGSSSTADGAGGQTGASSSMLPGTGGAASGGKGTSPAGAQGNGGSGNTNGSAAAGSPGTANAGSSAPGAASVPPPPGGGPACVTNADCTGTSQRVCASDGHCRECKNDDDCPNNGQCDPNGRCQQCLSAQGCPDGMHCRTDAQVCVACMQNDHCAAPTPACDIANYECVECTGPAFCKAPTPACGDDHKCYECISDTHCTAGTKRTCTAERKCVECVGDPQCAGRVGRTRCDEASNTCVACLQDADCTDPGAAQCDKATHTCVRCTSNTHCAARFSASAPQCNGGECVQCDEYGGICGEKACILSRHVCSKVDRHSISMCNTCESSDECADYACVTLSVGNYTRNVCLSGRGPKECSRPYTRAITNVPSPDGSPFANACAPPAGVTCEAVLDAIKQKGCMGNNSECGIDPRLTGLDDYDGFCSVNGVCTYHCSTDADCAGAQYCSGGWCR